MLTMFGRLGVSRTGGLPSDRAQKLHEHETLEEDADRKRCCERQTRNTLNDIDSIEQLRVTRLEWCSLIGGRDSEGTI
jgi:hypothetical protein